MLLPINAQAPVLSDEDARILDDEFFRSDPNAYFRARIAGLLRDNRDAVDVPTPESDVAFFDALGIEPVEGALDFDDGDRKRQVAVDALALRQHVAESLVRSCMQWQLRNPPPVMREALGWQSLKDLIS